MGTDRSAHGLMRADHGANTTVSQDFQQQAVGDTAVNDMYGVDAIACCIQGRRDLGQHAAGDRAIGKQLINSLGRQTAQQLACLVQHVPLGQAQVITVALQLIEQAPSGVPRRIALTWYDSRDADSPASGAAPPLQAGSRWQLR